MATTRHTAARVAIGGTVFAVLLTATAAFAGALPAQGVWSYDNTPTLKSAAGNAMFRGLLRVDSTGGSVYSVAVIVIGGTCKMKDGRTIHDSPVGGSAATLRVAIPVKANGSFSGTRNVVGDTGGKGTLLLKGVFAGIHASGTATLHMHDPVWGDCRGSGRFVRAKGTQVG
jgi:hypothetical protein